MRDSFNLNCQSIVELSTKRRCVLCSKMSGAKALCAWRIRGTKSQVMRETDEVRRDVLVHARSKADVSKIKSKLLFPPSHRPRWISPLAYR